MPTYQCVLFGSIGSTINQPTLEALINNRNKRPGKKNHFRLYGFDTFVGIASRFDTFVGIASRFDTFVGIASRFDIVLTEVICETKHVYNCNCSNVLFTRDKEVATFEGNLVKSY